MNWITDEEKGSKDHMQGIVINLGIKHEKVENPFLLGDQFDLRFLNVITS